MGRAADGATDSVLDKIFSGKMLDSERGVCGCMTVIDPVAIDGGAANSKGILRISCIEGKNLILVTR